MVVSTTYLHILSPIVSLLGMALKHKHVRHEKQTYNQNTFESQIDNALPFQDGRPSVKSTCLMNLADLQQKKNIIC